MPRGHKVDCRCTVCKVKRQGVEKRLGTLASQLSVYSEIAWNISKSILFAAPGIIGGIATLKAILYILSF